MGRFSGIPGMPGARRYNTSQELSDTMGDWIDALGSEEEKRRKSEEIHTQSQFRRAEIIGQKKDALWASLMAVINRDVDKFRTMFKGRRSVDLTTISPLGIRLFKSPYPTVLMDAEIPPNGTSIKVSYSRTFNQISPMERVDETFELTLDRSDDLVIAHNGRVFPNLDAVSRFLLEPVFKVD
jgi:hypothetical protein